MPSFAVPRPALSRDPCTCSKRLAQEKTLCAPCQAWEDGYVVVGGKPRYLRSLWILANRAEAVEMGWYKDE